MAHDLDEPCKFRERLLCGEREALAELFAQHRERLWRIVYFRLNARMTARVDPDDILQDAYLDASLRLPHYSEQKQFSPFVWLRMIVAQTLIDTHRRHLGAQQRDANREIGPHVRGFPQATSVSLAQCLLAHLTSPSMAAIRSELNAKLRKAVDLMDSIDQEVVALRHYEELTNKEVAEVLGISQKAASIRYVRAIARLKNILAEIPEFSNALVAE